MLKKVAILPMVFAFFCFAQFSYAQNENNIPEISAKALYDGMKNNSLKFSYNQELIIASIREFVRKKGL